MGAALDPTSHDSPKTAATGTDRRNRVNALLRRLAVQPEAARQ